MAKGGGFRDHWRWHRDKSLISPPHSYSFWNSGTGRYSLTQGGTVIRSSGVLMSSRFGLVVVRLYREQRESFNTHKIGLSERKFIVQNVNQGHLFDHHLCLIWACHPDSECRSASEGAHLCLGTQSWGYPRKPRNIFSGNLKNLFVSPQHQLCPPHIWEFCHISPLNPRQIVLSDQVYCLSESVEI